MVKHISQSTLIWHRMFSCLPKQFKNKWTHKYHLQPLCQGDSLLVLKTQSWSLTQFDDNIDVDTPNLKPQPHSAGTSRTPTLWWVTPVFMIGFCSKGCCCRWWIHLNHPTAASCGQSYLTQTSRFDLWTLYSAEPVSPVLPKLSVHVHL